MEKMSIGEIIEVVDGSLLSGNLDDTISYVSTSSRDIKEETLFVPIKGEKVDAHDFIKDAFKNGAKATFTEREKCAPNGQNCILVNNSREAFQKLAAYYRKKFNIPVIGVTGSVGKTTTKEMIASALSVKFSVMKTEANYNSQIGLPHTMFNMSPNHDIAVIEMGISEFGEMERLAKIAAPHHAVITNIGISHIENLKTQENICKEKLHITACFDDDSVLFLNGNDPILSALKDKLNVKVIYFGTEKFCDYRAEDIENDGENTSFTLVCPIGTDRIVIPTIGLHNVVNALAAIAVSANEGLTIQEIKTGLSEYRSISMRQQIHHINDVIIVDDSYNASPASMKGAINVLSEIRSNGNSIVVLADMLELGERAKQAHCEVGKYAAKNGVSIVVTVGELAKEIANGAKSINQDIITKVCSSNEEAEKFLERTIKPDDKVLVKGSRGMHTDEIVRFLVNKV